MLRSKLSGSNPGLGFNVRPTFFSCTVQGDAGRGMTIHHAHSRSAGRFCSLVANKSELYEHSVGCVVPITRSCIMYII